MNDNDFKLSVEINKEYNEALNQLKAATGKSKKALIIEFLDDGFHKYGVEIEK